jgi:hypothetical protein
MAAAHQRVERDDTLRQVLETAGVDYGLAAGIPLALDHYDTSPAYLAAVRDLALDAARVVAGDAEAAGELELAPDQGGGVPLDFAADLGDVDAADVQAEPEEDTPATTEAEAESEQAGADAESTAADTEPADTETETSETETADTGSTEAEQATPDDGTETAGTETEQPTADAESVETDAGSTADATDTATAEAATAEAGDAEPAAGDGEMYQLSEEERQEVEENFDVGFSSADEIPESGESDVDAPEPEERTDASADTAEADAAEPESAAPTGETDDELGDFDADDEAFDEAQDEDADDLDDFTEDESESDTQDAEAGSMELDLEDYVVDLMADLDDGDGAPREEVVATAADERDVDGGEVEDAIQDALMSGRCYESGDDHLKAI